MARLSQNELNLVLTEDREESIFNEKFFKKFQHPYWGLEDNRGSLTRYPLKGYNGEDLRPREEVEELLKVVNSFDNFEAYGPTPYKRPCLYFGGKYHNMPIELTLSQYILAWKIYHQKEYSGDFSRYSFIKERILEWGEFIQDKHDFDYVDVVKKREFLLRKAKWFFGKKTLWNMSNNNYKKLLKGSEGHPRVITFETWEKGNSQGLDAINGLLEKYPFMARGLHMSLNHECDETPTLWSGNTIYLKYRDQNHDIYINGKFWSPDFHPISKLAEEIQLKRNSRRKTESEKKEFPSISRIFDKEGKLLFSTTEYLENGYMGGVTIYKSQGSLLRFLGVRNVCTINSYRQIYSYERIPLKRVKGFFVGIFGDKTVVFKDPENSFLHIEGKSLRECMNLISKAQKAEEIGENISFRNVKERGWCVDGTKNFLYKTAPFIWRFIKDFSSRENPNWRGVPDEILDLSFSIRGELYPAGYNPNSLQSLWRN